MLHDSKREESGSTRPLTGIAVGGFCFWGPSGWIFEESRGTFATETERNLITFQPVRGARLQPGCPIRSLIPQGALRRILRRGRVR